jgi:uncharacterized protein YdaU (DUF1376 family)
MVTFYKHHIPDWMDGTEYMDAETYRTYHVICQLIYLNEGPITNNEHGIAGRCNQSVRLFRACLERLVVDGKLTLENGRLGNLRAIFELENLRVNREHARRGGENSRGVPKSSNKALKNNEQATAPLFEQNSLKEKRRLEKRREDSPSSKEEGRSGQLVLMEPATSKSPPSDPETELFRRGREVLGDNAGGMINQLLKAKGRPELARAAIEQAATKERPREYIGAIIRGNAADEKPPVII